jgi:hypothetical protein
MGRETDSALATVWPTLAIRLSNREDRVSIVNKWNITTSGFDEDALSITTPGGNIIDFWTVITHGDFCDPDPRRGNRSKNQSADGCTIPTSPMPRPISVPYV